MIAHYLLGYGLKVLQQRLLDGKKLKVISQFLQVIQEREFAHVILNLLLISVQLMLQNYTVTR